MEDDGPTFESRPDYCRTEDGLELAVYDFGGDGEDLLLVHATGFCADMFRPMVAELRGRYHCWGLDLRAHGRSDRPADGDFAWDGFARDVRAAVAHFGLERPAGFGHSCGGASLLLAEEARPGTFGTLYCFEPVVIPDLIMLPPEGNLLSARARRRRESFPSAEDAFVNFSTKPQFCDFDPAVLGWYVASGFEPVRRDEGGDGRSVRLRCRRDDEAEIYVHGATHTAFAHLDRIDVAVTLACGSRTDAFGPAILELLAARLATANLEVLDGLGHFGPFERPGLVAASVIHRLLTAGDERQV